MIRSNKILNSKVIRNKFINKIIKCINYVRVETDSIVNIPTSLIHLLALQIKKDL